MLSLRADAILSVLVEDEAIVACVTVLLARVALLAGLRLAILARAHMIGHTLAIMHMLTGWAHTIFPSLVEDEAVVASVAIFLALCALLAGLRLAVLTGALMV